MSDQHITAIATIVQDVVLLANGVLVGWYLYETHRMRKAAEQQVDKSHDLVATAQRQLAVSQKQIRISLQEAEDRISPAVAIRRDRSHDRFLGENVGYGPAIDLRFVTVAAGGAVQWDASPDVSTSLNGSFLPIGERPSEDVSVSLAGGPDREMHILYKSLSGRRYSTVVTFDRQRQPIETAFASMDSVPQNDIVCPSSS